MTKDFSFERFIKQWQGAKSLGEAAKLAGMTKDNASALASRCRDRGIPLKRFRNKNKPLDGVDIKALADLAKKESP